MPVTPNLAFWRMLGPDKKILPSRLSPPSVETGLCCGCFGSSCKVLVGKLEQFSYRLRQKCKKWTCDVSAARGAGDEMSVCVWCSGQKCWEMSLVLTFFEEFQFSSRFIPLYPIPLLKRHRNSRPSHQHLLGYCLGICVTLEKSCSELNMFV